MTALPPVLAGRDGTTRTIPVLAPALTSSSTRSRDKIHFLHPGYPAAGAANLLFSLPCVDRAPGGGYGVHHRTALTACQIVANNAFDGFLASDAEGKERIDQSIGMDDNLTRREYFFVVEGESRYPIVPSFRDWTFPHDRLPSAWNSLSQNNEVNRSKCQITGYPWAITNAHLVPRIEADWFKRNGMARYGSSSAPDIDDPKNILPLKKDIHDCIDRHMFAIVPKGRSETSGVEGILVHVLADEQPLFAELHHDILLESLGNVAPEYLFARFAHAILIRLKPFLVAGFTRRTARFTLLSDKSGCNETIEELDGPSLESQYGSGKSRSASPRKRKLLEEAGDSLSEISDDDSSVDEPLSPESWDESERGRSRKRRRFSGKLDGSFSHIVSDNPSLYLP